MVYFFQRLLSPGFHLNARYSVPKTRNHHPRITTGNAVYWKLEKVGLLALSQWLSVYWKIAETDLFFLSQGSLIKIF
jgi:hypothetical protein